jgi:hypothetical protein
MYACRLATQKLRTGICSIVRVPRHPVEFLPSTSLGTAALLYSAPTLSNTSVSGVCTTGFSIFCPTIQPPLDEPLAEEYDGEDDRMADVPIFPNSVTHNRAHAQTVLNNSLITFDRQLDLQQRSCKPASITTHALISDSSNVAFRSKETWTSRPSKACFPFD